MKSFLVLVLASAFSCGPAPEVEFQYVDVRCYVFCARRLDTDKRLVPELQDTRSDVYREPMCPYLWQPVDAPTVPLWAKSVPARQGVCWVMEGAYARIQYEAIAPGVNQIHGIYFPDADGGYAVP